MNNSINLLVPEHEQTNRQKRNRIMRGISLSFMGIIVLISVGLFFLILASPLPGLRQEEAAILAKLREQRSKSAKLFLTKERLAAVSTLIKTRPEFDVVLNAIIRTLPAGATIDAIKVDADMVEITVSSSSLQTINSFIESMKTMTINNKELASISLSSLSYGEKNAGYAVIVQATL